VTLAFSNCLLVSSLRRFSRPCCGERKICRAGRHQCRPQDIFAVSVLRVADRRAGTGCEQRSQVTSLSQSARILQFGSP
jgi:hypothetical protein